MSTTLPRMPRRPIAWVLLGLVALAASACQVRVGADIAIDADGAGRVALTVALDQELTASLAADGFDPFAGLEELADGWTASREQVDGGQAITVTSEFDDPAGLTARVADLADGIDAEDPLILDDVAVVIDQDGNATFTGRAGFRPPSSTGLRGAGVTFDGDDLAAMLAERGDEVMRVDLRVTMPGPVVDSNATTVDGATAVWQLPVTDLVEVRAVSEPAPSRLPWILAGAAVLGLVIGVIGASALRRR